MMLSDNLSPKLLDDLYIYSSDDRILYLNPEIPDWISIRAKYKPIFQKFNGNFSFSDIKKFIFTKYSSDSPEKIIGQFENLLTNCYLFCHSSIAVPFE